MLDTGHTPDHARFYTGVCEPFAMQLRRLGHHDVELIRWYVAAVNEGEPVNPQEAGKFEVEY
ncbi:hypothetical protein TOPH_05028 [Tolypocladium ophioglossoides CBS 100239]|uniref:Uncharacterized protein n=1 Tax=Tolypocladium ophioglossoides (strain CBS 100239) TaxID=1163406 RepID=A0A0L0N8J0_TOLOC|nr:hypothetical protein TOPH_05028 [Tolypocladium ophioglossoides CBS 100239]